MFADYNDEEEDPHAVSSDCYVNDSSYVNMAGHANHTNYAETSYAVARYVDPVDRENDAEYGVDIRQVCSSCCIS